MNTLDNIMQSKGFESYEQAANYVVDNQDLFTVDLIQEASYFLLRMMVEDG